MRRGTGVLAAIFMAALLALPGTARAQDAAFGPQISLGDDTDFGIGGRAVVNLSDYEGWEAVGSFDLFFPDSEADYWEINGNLLYNFPVESTRTFFPYVGGGLNVAHVDFPADGDDTDLGLNLVGGGKFDAEGLTPYVEARVEIEGGEQFVLTGGLLFP